MEKLSLNKELIYELYITKNLKLKEVAETTGWSKTEIIRKVKEYNLHKHVTRLNNDLIKHLYIEDKKTTVEIARELYTCSETIYRRLVKMGVYKEGRIKSDHDFSNKQIDHLYVIKLAGTKKHCKSVIRIWLCRCDCGNLVEIPSSILSNNNTSKWCRKPNCIMPGKSKTGYKELRGTYWACIKDSAKDRGLEFSINIEYAYNKFIEKERKCVLTGIELYFSSKAHLYDGTASLDRIDSSKGYVDGNIQWIHKGIQKMKCDREELDFIKWCGLIWEHSKGRLDDLG